MNPQFIRNFSIIAHIDHGKSTLADRMLGITGTIEERKMQAQVLDSMELERERGITIKMQPVRMKFKPSVTFAGAVAGQEYILNLIDTPGHIDFSYEVSRALKAVEGSILLVDSTQGVQAQTLTTLNMARESGLTIIPVISKIDSPLARIPEVMKEICELLDCDESAVVKVSGKTGEGVAHLLEQIIARVHLEEVVLGRFLAFDRVGEWPLAPRMVADQRAFLLDRGTCVRDDLCADLIGRAEVEKEHQVVCGGV